MSTASASAVLSTAGLAIASPARMVSKVTENFIFVVACWENSFKDGQIDKTV